MRLPQWLGAQSAGGLSLAPESACPSPELQGRDDPRGLRRAGRDDVFAWPGTRDEG